MRPFPGGLRVWDMWSREAEQARRPRVTAPLSVMGYWAPQASREELARG